MERKKAIDYLKVIKTPIAIAIILITVLVLMVVTPVEYLPVVISLIEALTQVMLMGDLNVIQ